MSAGHLDDDSFAHLPEGNIALFRLHFETGGNLLNGHEEVH